MDGALRENDVMQCKISKQSKTLASFSMVKRVENSATISRNSVERRTLGQRVEYQA